MDNKKMRLLSLWSESSIFIHETVNLWGDDHEIGALTKIGAFCDVGAGVKIGKNCKIQCFVSIPPGSVIGDNVFLGPHVGIANHKHIEERGDWHLAGAIIEDNVSVGMGAMIGPGVRLGKGCVIGMGAVVTKDVPAGETWVGNPAKPLPQRVG